MSPISKSSNENINFGRRAVAAAFEITEVELGQAIHEGAFPAPDFVSDKDLRWLLLPTLVREIKARYVKVDSPAGLVDAMRALNRMEAAEGATDAEPR